MTGLFKEAVDRLRSVQGALHVEMERLSRAEAWDRAALRKLRDLAQAVKLDAHSLLLRMLFEDAPPDFTDAADELLDVFCQVVSRADALLSQDAHMA
jgi:hypothetical protein